MQRSSEQTQEAWQVALCWFRDRHRKKYREALDPKREERSDNHSWGWEIPRDTRSIRGEKESSRCGQDQTSKVGEVAKMLCRTSPLPQEKYREALDPKREESFDNQCSEATIRQEAAIALR